MRFRNPAWTLCSAGHPRASQHVGRFRLGDQPKRVAHVAREAVDEIVIESTTGVEAREIWQARRADDGK